MYKNLQEYIDRLESLGELQRVAVKVDPILEITEITDRISKMAGGGKALLFENTGTQFPVLTNMMGSDRRMAAALSVETLDEITARLDKLISEALSPKEKIRDKLSMLPLMAEAARWVPKKKRGLGECQQVVYRGGDADLGMLPILKCWPYDGGRFITLPLVHTADPETGMCNVGMYRMQVTGKDTTGIHWHLHKTGERHYRGYKKAGKRMPVSVCLGGDPVYTYCATAPMPDNLDEYLLAGFLRGKSVRLVKCLTNDMYVPSDCDFVIEGYVDPSEDKFMEGPFGDHTGFYSLEDLYPRFNVTAITHRKDAVYPATIVGIPPQEDAYIAKATEKIFLAPIRAVLQPEVTDLYMPAAGVAHNLALVSIDESYPEQAFKTAGALWGAGQMMFNKIMLVAGSDTDIRDAEQIAACIREISIPEDVLLSRGVLDVLDHAAQNTGRGGKVVLDLTRCRPSEDLQWPEDLPLPEGALGIEVGLAARWAMLLVPYEHTVETNLEELARAFAGSGIKFIIAADKCICKMSEEDILWFCAANYEPARDTRIVEGILIADARTKSPHREGYPARVPNIVVSSRQTIELVDRRWKEYGFTENIGSPSTKYSSLLHGEGATVTR